jgi:hypothetical protein
LFLFQKETTQKTIEGVSDHILLSFLNQTKGSMHKKISKSVGKFKSSEKKQDDRAYLRRKFPNLKTKAAFPLFAPYILIKLIYIGIYRRNKPLYFHL